MQDNMITNRMASLYSLISVGLGYNIDRTKFPLAVENPV